MLTSSRSASSIVRNLSRRQRRADFSLRNNALANYTIKDVLKSNFASFHTESRLLNHTGAVNPFRSPLCRRYFTTQSAAVAFDTLKFKSLLSTNHIGRNLLYFDSVASTQDVIRDEALSGALHGMVCLAERQEKGRGRAGRDWSSQEALNITASFLIRPKFAQNIPCINFAAAIAVAEAAKEFGVDAKLKWPNDVWCNGKKLCGVLTDAEFLGSNIFITLGIGINVNQSISTESLLSETATSFSDILGREIPREELFASVCNALESLIDLDMKDILDKYRQYDMLIGRQIVVMPKRREGPLSDRFEARALGLDPEQGCLVVQTTDGTRKLLSAEEVSIRPGP